MRVKRKVAHAPPLDGLLEDGEADSPVRETSTLVISPRKTHGGLEPTTHLLDRRERIGSCTLAAAFLYLFRVNCGTTMKVAAFNGSPKRDGNTARLLGYALEELEAAGCETELVHVGGWPLRGCAACGRCFERRDGRCANETDEMNGFIESMVGADGILIGSPTYYADVTSETKALIDRAAYVALANGGLFRRKVGAAVVVNRRAGGIHAFDTINHLFLYSEMVVVGSSYWNIGVGLAPGDVDADVEGVGIMRTLGRNMAWALERLAVPGKA